LPENTTIETAIEELFLLQRIDAGRKDLDAGNFVTHEEMKREFAAEELPDEQDYMVGKKSS
jgi:predicted transcriptional regulator